MNYTRIYSAQIEFQNIPYKHYIISLLSYHRKLSNAGKVLLAEFEELKDMAAEFVMNNIPPDLIINWDQLGLKIVPTGE